MRKIESLVNALRENEQIYVRISRENYDTFFSDCDAVGIHQFFTCKKFKREDVRGLMSINHDRSIGYVSNLCFMAAVAGKEAVNRDNVSQNIIVIDYDKLLRGEDYLLTTDKSVTLNGKQLTGRIITIHNN